MSDTDFSFPKKLCSSVYHVLMVVVVRGDKKEDDGVKFLGPRNYLEKDDAGAHIKFFPRFGDVSRRPCSYVIFECLSTSLGVIITYLFYTLIVILAPL